MFAGEQAVTPGFSGRPGVTTQKKQAGILITES
jgi:hypothetical protein